MVLALPGRTSPLGASSDATGCNFAVCSSTATRIDVSLIGADGGEVDRFELAERDGHVFHGRIDGIGPGQRYGLRVDGAYTPSAGVRHNHNKLLLDPYAKAVAGDIRWGSSVHGATEDDDVMNTSDSLGSVPAGVVVDDAFDWGDDSTPTRALADHVVYEVHLKGFTRLHPDIPPPLRGTYAGFAHPASIASLTSLGVSAVELLPVHHTLDREVLRTHGLVNYWGYDPIAYFAPDARFSSSGDTGGQVTEFKSMVRALHSAGIAVIIDVVFNHTVEANEIGPTLSFRGIDNGAYYRLIDNNQRHYIDVTGCNNTVNTAHPQTRRLIVDSLRYWVESMHVDGFRFDLASVLGRQGPGFSFAPDATLFEIIADDPVLSKVILIAEPWDLGGDGYQVGHFPPGWADWNDRYRDSIRDLWRGRGDVATVAYRLTGSSDIFPVRGPSASINYVTAHDGFTLRDLVSYGHKHNDANNESNHDGTDNNRSWNCGVEGDTTDPAVVALRARQQRNFLATLLLSQGVPMITAGDEIGRTQRGNNNAYCQDNEISWIDWEHADTGLRAFVQHLVAIRNDHPVLRRRSFFTGVDGITGKDVVWLRPDGEEMGDADWADGSQGTLGIWLNGERIGERHDDGSPVCDTTLCLLLNASATDSTWTIPGRLGTTWDLLVDTSRAGDAQPQGDRIDAPTRLTVDARSVALLRRVDA